MNWVGSLSNDSLREITALIVVIAGPSGVGKDVLIERMDEIGQIGFHFTVTATTRQPRPDETDGINHLFFSDNEFQNLIATDELLEWAFVYGNYYGVPKKQVQEALSNGNHVIIRVDVQGAKRVRELIPDALLLFIIPPSIDVLRKHLKLRGVNSEPEMNKRLAAAAEEISQSDAFDYVVTNEENHLDETVKRVVEIIEYESSRMPPRKTII
jgi:guanylate kinase